MKKILVIIPCYNEEDSIAVAVANLKRHCPQCDYIVINDSSTDSSLKILQEGSYSYLNLPVNLGIGGGVQSGYMYAVENGYDVTVQMDGDCQHDPAYIERIIEPVLNGELDMCIGSRFIEKEGFQTSGARRAGIKFLSILIKLLTGRRVLDVTSGFRACNKELTEYYSQNYAQDFPEPEAIISAITNGFTVGERAVIMHERTGGVSSIGFIGGIYYMIKVSLSLIALRFVMGKKKNKKQKGAA